MRLQGPGSPPPGASALILGTFEKGLCRRRGWFLPGRVGEGAARGWGPGTRPISLGCREALGGGVGSLRAGWLTHEGEACESHVQVGGAAQRLQGLAKGGGDPGVVLQPLVPPSSRGAPLSVCTAPHFLHSPGHPPLCLAPLTSSPGGRHGAWWGVRAPHTLASD